MKWIHQRGVIDFIQMTDFSLALRNQLSEIAEVKPPAVEECFISPEGTKKYLIKLDSGSMIEMVKIPEKKKIDTMHLFSSRMRIAMHFLCNRCTRF